MMELPCPCGRTLGYESRHIGMRVRCPGCRLFHAVPDPTKPAEPTEVPAPDRARGPLASRGVGEWLSSGPAFAVLLFVACTGVGLLVHANGERKVSNGATELPRVVPCRRLLEEGPEGNPHVLVTDALAGQNYFTRVRVTKAEQAGGNTSGKPWEAVYLPLVPLTPELKTRMARGETLAAPPGRLIRLVLVSHKIRNKDELAQVFDREGAVQGLIVDSTGLGAETEDVLRRKFPGIDLKRVLILEPGRKPTGRASVLLLFVGGSALLAAAVGLGIVAVVFRTRQ